MATQKIILLHGLTKADENLITGLLTLQPAISNGDWVITNHGEGNITIIDLDNPQGIGVARELIAKGRIVYCLTAQPRSDLPCMYLRKPLRSKALLSCFEEIAQYSPKQVSGARVSGAHASS